ncbi:mediator of RNA polymerase ii transcription subunit 7 [Anaeramoeba ignava]|uniref:Mediator of RNA polymerase II transcription subunit 7 n=1 Tax=Anaeramoeba ignava TaxID=1746090 RepID=A0A9Q0LV94_ANAIG|nr:mediator of RNA polymerase ii transcription subunit 7 [Anaeramoeba ignava]
MRSELYRGMFLSVTEDKSNKNFSFSIFGEQFSTRFSIPQFEDLKNRSENAKQLFEDLKGNEINELKKLNHSLLFLFYELVDLLLKNPDLFSSKIQAIENVLVNFHYIIDTIRLHQAREMIIDISKDQIERRKKAIQSIEDSLISSQKSIKDVIEKIKNKK